jgi:hypothetical protein
MSIAPSQFDWPVAYPAEERVSGFLAAFLRRHAFAHRFAERLRTETGTDFAEWVDHFTIDPVHAPAFLAVGFEPDLVECPAGASALAHPRAQLPRILVQPDGSADGTPARLALRVESLDRFRLVHALSSPIEGGPGAGLRRLLVATDGDTRLEAVERLAHRGFVAGVAGAKPESVAKVRELWLKRERQVEGDANLLRLVRSLQRYAISLVGPDIAADLFFAAERAYWQSRNHAGRIQFSRQDALGLGWANHDHHTYRCSRPFFSDTVEFFIRFGFARRERYYAGAEAGWGAQIMEHAATGVVVFADVDLGPTEIAVDFSSEKLPESPTLGTVGLWCALHGDSLLQAGMHHLEARFDFSRLRDQLATHGIATMKPFSEFPFLTQAFTAGERWPVTVARAEKLLVQGQITREQFTGFVREGAVGSHLENLQRRGGFKGFNQHAVSAIIAATDPRKLQEAAHA